MNHRCTARTSFAGLLAGGIGCRNPILCHALGLCSALAVTGFVRSTLVMGAALLFVASFSALIVSLLRGRIPARTRFIVQMLIISTLVVVVHLFLRVYCFDVSCELGPYVGLIITNCVILARCDTFAIRNGPARAFLDAFGAAAGYAVVLLAVALIREPLGHGSLLGARLAPEGFRPALLVASAPGAFLALGLIVWVVRAIWPLPESERHPEVH